MRKLRCTWTVVVLLAILAWGCGRSPEARRDRFIAQGKAFLQKGDYQRAILELKNATQATPKDPEAYYQLGIAYLAGNDISRGVAGLRKALELNPKHTAAQLRLAQLMTNASNQDVLKDAQQRLRMLLQDSPDDPDALHALALTELKLGDPGEAMRHLEQAIAAAPRDLVLAATLAETKLREKDRNGAEEVLKKACADSPKSADCVVILGRLYAAENRLPEAEQKFRQAVAMDPNNAAALLNLATLESATGRKPEAEEAFKRLSGLPDKTFKAYHAIFLFQEGRRDEALKEFEALARQDPTDRMARTRLAAAYQAMNRLPAARKLLSEVLKKNPKDLDALLQRGEMFLSDGRYAEAEADLNQVVHLRPDAPQVHYVLAKLYLARGSSLRQRQELNEVLRLGPSLLQPRLELAASLIRENDGDAALAVLDAAPQDQKNVIAFVEQRNWALLSTRQFAEARKEVDKGLERTRTLDLLMQDANLKITEKRYDAARGSLHEAMARNPEDLRLLRLLVGSYAAQNQVPAAVREVQAYAAKNPKSGPIQYFLGSLLLQTGARDQARQVLSAAKALNYTSADLSLAQIDLLQADWKNGRQELNAILSAQGENSQARQWLGMLEVVNGSPTAAIADFRKVLESQPDNAIALNNLAFLLAENGQAGEARKYAERAVELAPDNPLFEGTLGWVFYRMGLFDSAVTHLQPAVSKGGDTRQEYYLSAAYFRKGDAVRGQEILTAALRKNPNLPEAKLAQQAAREATQKRQP